MNTKIVSNKDIKVVIDCLNNLGIVCFPTDTVFGLACLMDKKAIDKIYKAKGRRLDKPLPVMVNNLTMLNKIAYVNDEAKTIINKFTPGALTIVLPLKEEIDHSLFNGLNTVAIRIPDDEYILNLIAKLDKPLMVTSANISDTPSLFNYEDVYNSLKDRVDIVVKGEAKGDRASTIVSMVEDMKILRAGPISLQDLKEAIK